MKDILKICIYLIIPILAHLITFSSLHLLGFGIVISELIAYIIQLIVIIVCTVKIIMLINNKR